VIEFAGFWERCDGSLASENRAADTVGGCHGLGREGGGEGGSSVGDVPRVRAAHNGGVNHQ
jgi:hypothetical protein